MAHFSIGEAAFAGFRVLGRKPGVIVGWGLLIFVCVFLPMTLMAGSFTSGLGDLVREAAAMDAAQTSGAAGKDAVAGAPTAATEQAIMRMMSGMMAAYPMLILGSLVLSVVLRSAVIRSVLEPDQDSWFYLRLGMRELWILLVSIVLGIILWFGMMFALLPLGIMGGVFYATMGSGSTPTGGALIALAVTCLYVLVVAVAFAIVSLRLYMAIPMAWDHNEFRLFEGWRFTKGQGLKMLMLLLLQILIIVVLEVVIIGIVGAIAYLSFRGITPMNEEQFTTFLTRNAGNLVWQSIAVSAGAGLVISLIGAVFNAILAAPWADVYRQLRDSGASHTPAYTPALGEAPINPPSPAV